MKKIIFILPILMVIPVLSFAQAKLLIDGFRFTEGPAINENGQLYFSDVPESKIYKYTDNKLLTFLDNTGGANGLYFDEEGNLIACAGRARQLISISPEKQITVLADEFQSKKLNSPNDLWIDPHGGIYFTDPRYGNKDNLEQDGMHVYYLSPEKKLIRVTEDLVRPNGIIGTPDGKTLYIVDQGVEKTYRYKIKAKGHLSDKTLFAEVGSDGMSVNRDNDVYITNGKKVDRYNPEGDLIKSYDFPAMATNVVWSPSKIYVTTQAGQVFIIEE